MSKDKQDLPKSDEAAVENVKSADAARKSSDAATKEDELEEGLEESFPGSDAPASTRRSSKD